MRIEFDRRLIGEAALRRELDRSAGGGQGISDSSLSTVAVQDDRQGDDDAHCNDEKGHEGHDHAAHGGIFGARTELIFSGICGLLLLAGWTMSKVSGVPESLVLTLFVTAYGFGGWFALREAIEALRAGHFEIDFLMLVAAAGAAALGAWAEGALLLLLFSLGHALEGYAMGRAKRAIEALGELAPKTARVLRGEGTEQVPVEALAIDDIVVVRPNERLPADGFVVSGTSSVDQAPITGESVPVDKSPVEDADRAAGAPDALEAANRL